tara:strand:- start:88 stop:1251 length:1164 start_codon:yes stop_codon:yes gene_type:complete
MFWASDNKDLDNWNEFYFRFFSEFLNYHKFQNEQDCRLYLNKLKPFCKNLWDSYQKNSGNINTDYSSDLTQEAYFLRYGPLYSHSINYVLNDLYKNKDIDPLKLTALDDQGYLPRDVSIFSAGPATEMWGILKFLMETYNPHMDDYITFSTVDKISWNTTRLMTENAIKDYLEEWHVPYKENTGPKIFHHQSDNLLDERLNYFKDSNLILFQNCLNEYLSQKSEEEVLYFLSGQLNGLAKNGILLFSERTNYNSGNLLEKFFYQSNQEIDLVFKGSFKLRPYALSNIPSIIREELLTGEDKLIPSLKNDIEVTVYRKKDFPEDYIKENREFERYQEEEEKNLPADWEWERDQMNSAPDPLWSEDESASEAWSRGRDLANESYWDDED